MIRSVTPGDLWALRRTPRNQIVLYTTSLLVQPHQPFWFALRCFLEGTGRDRSTLVFAERGIRALAQARGRSGRTSQDIIYLAAQGSRNVNQPSDYDVWFRLLERLCVDAGHNNIQRLYASIWDQQGELREIFRQLGFQAYVNRVILQLSGPDWDQGTTLAPMRSQSRQDAWAVHKLYGAIAPHIVQYAEVRTPRDWIVPLGQRWQEYRQRAWVWLGDDLIAYLHLLSGPIAHVLKLLIRPDERESVTDVIRFGLAQVHDNRPVYLVLCEYQTELLTPAQSLGFQPIGDQTVLVKHMLLPVQRSMLLPAFEAGLKRRAAIPGISARREDLP